MEESAIQARCAQLFNSVTIVKNLKKLRINVQYYMKKPEEVDDKSVAGFVLKCRHIFNSLSFDEIKEIRKKITGVISESKKKSRGEGEDA